MTDQRYSQLLALLSFLPRLFLFTAAVLAHKLLDTTRCINELLPAGEEWMTSRTDLQADFWNCRASFKSVPTCTYYFCWHVVWMNTFFQRKPLLLRTKFKILIEGMFTLDQTYVLYHRTHNTAIFEAAGWAVWLLAVFDAPLRWESGSKERCSTIWV